MRFIDRHTGHAAVLKQMSEWIEMNELHSGHCQTVQDCRAARSEARIIWTVITGASLKFKISASSTP